VTDAWRPELTDEDWLRLIGRPDPLIIEVGCNDGTDTQRFLNTFPECQIVCFEPDPRAIARFKRTITDPRVTLVEAAAADRDGWSPWFASHGEVPKGTLCHVDAEALADWDLSGSIRQPTGHVDLAKWCMFTQTFDVQVVSLDTWIESMPGLQEKEIDLLWIDVQGAESDVIRGARKALSRTRFVFTEFYDPTFSQYIRGIPELYDGAPGLAEIIGLIWSIGPCDLRGFFVGGNMLLEMRGV